MTKYIEHDFPVARLNPIAEKEGNARKPIYQIHKWWARRLGSVFRMILLTSFLEWEEMEQQAKTRLQGESDFESLPSEGKEIKIREEMENILWEHFYSKTDLGGRTVLDPFMGGGTTIVEALRLGLRPIGIDLNPVAWFVTKKEVDPVDLNALEEAFKHVEARVAERIKGFYKTRCPHPLAEEERELHGRDEEEHLADVVYLFWVKKVRCISCGEDVKLFNSFRIASKKDGEVLLCPNCGEVFTHKGKTEEATCPACKHTFDYTQGYTQRGDYLCPHCGQRYPIIKALKEEGDHPPRAELFAVEYYCPIHKIRDYKKADGFDKALFERAKQEFEAKRDELIGKWIPDQEVPDGFNTKQMLNYNYRYFYQMFNKRQLLLLAELLQAIAEEEDENLREFLLLTFDNVISYSNMFSKLMPRKGRLGSFQFIFVLHGFWPQDMPAESNIWGIWESGLIGSGGFLHHFVKLVDALKVTDYLTVRDSVQLLAVSSDNLNSLDLKKIDIVVTDPPYYDNVMYSELSDFFYNWQRLLLKDRYDWFKPRYTPKIPEIVVNPKQGKNEEDFIEGLTRVYRECHRVLKDDGLMVFTFHHKETKAWAAALKAVLNAGFFVTAAYPIHAEMKTSAHILDKQSIQYDTIIVCRKRAEEPERAESWEVLKDQIYLKALQEIQDIKRFKMGFVPLGKPQPEFDLGVSETRTKVEPERRLSEADVFVVVIGKCLELFSKHYPKVMKNGEPVEVEQAIIDIEEVVESIVLEEERKILPAGLDEGTQLYLVYLLGRARLSYNELNKRLRSGGYAPEELEAAGLLQRKKGDYLILSPRERADYVEGHQDKIIDWVHYLYNLYRAGEDLVPHIPRAEAKKIAEVCRFIHERLHKKEYLEIGNLCEQMAR